MKRLFAICLVALVVCFLTGCFDSAGHYPSRTVSLTEANFAAVVLQGKKPVLVEFGATWCAPCRAMEPVLEELAEEYQNRAVVGKVDVDKSQSLVAEYGIDAVPTFMFFKDGNAVRIGGGLTEYRWVRSATKKQLIQVLDGLLPAG